MARGYQRDAPARWLKQVIKESCHSDLARHFDEVYCETQLKQALVHQYVGRRSCGVAVYHQAAAHETLGEYSRQYGQEIKGTGNPSLEPRRRFPNSFHHFSCAPIRFSLHQGLNQAGMRIRLARGTALAAPLRRGISRRLPALSTDPAH